MRLTFNVMAVASRTTTAITTMVTTTSIPRLQRQVQALQTAAEVAPISPEGTVEMITFTTKVPEGTMATPESVRPAHLTFLVRIDRRIKSKLIRPLIIFLRLVRVRSTCLLFHKKLCPKMTQSLELTVLLTSKTILPNRCVCCSIVVLVIRSLTNLRCPAVQFRQ